MLNKIVQYKVTTLMGKIKEIRRYTTAALVSVMNILTGLITLPYATTNLTTIEYEFWIIFINLQIFINLFEFGMGPNIARYYTYLANGATKIRTNALPVNYKNNSYLLSDFKKYIIFIYIIIFVTSLVVTMGITNIYLYIILNQRDLGLDILAVWSCAALFLCLNLSLGFCNAILIGSDKIELSNITLITNRLLFLITCMSSLALDIGIWAFPVAVAFSVIFSRTLSLWMVYRDIKDAAHQLTQFKNSWRKTKYFNKILFPPVIKLAITQLSSFTLQRFTLFASPILLGPTISVQYMLTINIFQALYSFSLIPVNLTITKVIVAQKENQTSKITSLIKKIYIREFIIYLLLALILTVNYDRIMLYLGVVQLDFEWVLVLAVVTYFLELTHVTAAMIITSFNKVPFAKSAVISSILVIILTVSVHNAATAFYLLLIQFSVQAAYNNWFWPLYLFHQIKARHG